MMKQFSLYTISLHLFFFNFISLHAQQSKGLETRPENVSMGEVNKDKMSQIVIADVPTYNWHRGCGPTALGMVVGYYDAKGYPDLVLGNASTQTTDVNKMMATQAHYDDYSKPLDYYPNMIQDKSELGGAHVANSLADFMKTSWSSSGNYWGWTWSGDLGASFNLYAMQKNGYYHVTTDYEYYDGTAWDAYKEEIDNNRPVVFLVDTNGDNTTDHFVTGIGYDEATNKYGIYDTWDNSIHWYEFRAMSNSYSWGIFGFSKFQLTNSLDTKSLQNKFIITPNPTKDKIFLKGVSQTTIQYKLYDILGKLVLQGTSVEINLNAIKSGVYLLKINDGTNEIIRKVIKE